MKRERHMAARLAGWDAVHREVVRLQDASLPDFLATTHSREEEAEAKTTYISFLARMRNWLVVNKPRGI